MSSSPLRPLAEADAEQVATLFVESFGAARAVDAEEIRTWLRNEELRPEWMRVLERDGRVAGYGDIWVDDVVQLDVAAPGHWDVFVDWAEEEARARGVPAVRLFFPDGHELTEVARRRGYAVWRSSYTMEIGLTERPQPSPPPGFAVRPYRATDEPLVRAALNEAFADDPSFGEPLSESNFREFNLKARGFDAALWPLAFDGDELAGFVLAYDQHGGDTSLGWVGTLGVRKAWRGRGLGSFLLETAFALLHDRGLRRVGLGVDTENVTGALRIYERAGMMPVFRGDTWAKRV